MSNIPFDSYRSKLLDKTTVSLDEMLEQFRATMPQSYFETNDEATIMQHLAAVLFAKIAGNQERIVLANQDATEQTFIHFGSYPGLLSDILDLLPEEKSIRAARAYTAEDNSLIIDVFNFGKPDDDSETTDQLRRKKSKALAAALTLADPHNASIFINSVNSFYLQRFSVEEIAQHYQLMSKVSGTLDVATEMVPLDDGGDHFRVAFAAGQIEPTNLFKRLARYFSTLGIDIRETFLVNFDQPEQHQAALVVLVIQGEFSTEDNREEFLRSLSDDMQRLPYLDQAVLDLSFSGSRWSLIHAEVMVGLCYIAHQLLASDKTTSLSRIALLHIVQQYAHIARDICMAFLQKFTTDSHDHNRSDQLLASIDNAIAKDIENREHEVVLGLLKRIVTATLKSNVHSTQRYGLGFRLAPELFLADQRPDLAFGIFFVHGKAFDGFHVRFQDIARGGVRIVQPAGMEQYAIDVIRLFDEVYGLSYAQQLKNKDIPEGGSKGVILVKPGANKIRCGKAFVNSLLDLIVEQRHLNYPRMDYYQNPEWLFLGPDENVSNELIEWIISRARQRQYGLPDAFMSSKPNAGINHKVYGVTSEGVNVFLDEGLRYLGVNPKQQTFTVKITGGPDGDVAGNLIKILHRDYGDNAKIAGIADGSGCAEDPEGLDHTELLRLVDSDLTIAHFDASVLSESGRIISITHPGGAEARNTLHNRIVADVFIPSGGRPGTINEHNYDSFLQANGSPSAKLIVEGANLFLTPHAREKLTEKGVLIVKDSSANKCGVICSSYEIIASMMLSEEEFLLIKEDFVREVIDNLKTFAMLEAKTLFRELYFRPELSLTQLSLSLSAEINKLTDAIAGLIEVGTIPQQGFIQAMLLEFIPHSLKKQMGDRLLETLPHAYIIRAMASILASRIIYHEGIDYLATLATKNVARHVTQYLVREEKNRALIQQVEGADLADKQEIIELLKRGGTGTALRWRH